MTIMGYKAGYKKTNFGYIPDDWELIFFGDISNITRLAGYEYSEYWREDSEGEIIALRGYNIGRNEIINKDISKISNKLSMKLKRSRLYKGDIVFPCVGTIGNAVVIKENDKYHINQNIAKITPKKELNSDYFVQFLMSPYCRKEIQRFNATTSQPNVLVGSLRQFRIPLPPLPEQKKIAKILSAWDVAIATTEKLIAAKEQLKKGLMQQLLTGKKRFKEFEGQKWKEEKLGKLSKSFSGGTPSRKNLEYYNGDIPWIKSGEVNQRIITNIEESITSQGYKNSSAKIVDPGTILIAMYGATAGKIAITKIRAAINQAILAVIPNKILNNNFLFNFLERELNNVVKNVQGGQPNLNAQIIKSAKIKVPSIKEQNKIASALNMMDIEIQILRKKFNALQNQKKGLMQQLLTGKVRVKIDDNEK